MLLLLLRPPMKRNRADRAHAGISVIAFRDIRAEDVSEIWQLGEDGSVEELALPACGTLSCQSIDQRAETQDDVATEWQAESDVPLQLIDQVPDLDHQPALRVIILTDPHDEQRDPAQRGYVRHSRLLSHEFLHDVNVCRGFGGRCDVCHRQPRIGVTLRVV